MSDQRIDIRSDAQSETEPLDVTGEAAAASNSSPQNDQLLTALAAVTRLHHRPRSAESLVAGLPLNGGLLTPSLFVRAAKNAGFSAKIKSIPLAEISSLLLPVTLLLKGNRTCILLEIHQDHCIILFNQGNQNSEEIDLETLTQLYTGTSLYCKPTPIDHSDLSDSTAKENHWFWQTIKQSRGIYGEVLLASLMVNLFALVSPLFIMNVYDRVVPNHAIDTLWVLASGAFIAFTLDLILKSLRGYFIDIAGKRADILLSSKTFAKVMDIKMDQRPARVGAFANNLQEFDSFREFFTSSTIVTVIDLPFVVLFLVIIYSVAGPLVMVPMIAIPLILLACWLLQPLLRDVIQKTFAVSAKKHAMLIETLGALDAVKGARAEGVLQRRWEDFNARLARLSLKSRLLTLGTINLAQTVQQVASIVVVIMGVYLIMDGELTVGGLIASTILTGRCLAPMGQVAGILTRYHHSIAAFKAIDNVMNLEVERPASKHFLHRATLDGGITFKHVGFSYPNQKVPALDDISFDINSGEKIAIIGKMGSGKSTLQRLIMKFYTPSQGTILVSGTDINQVDPTDLRRNINYIPQDTILMDGSIRENIVLGEPLSSDEAVLAAAKLAGLTDFVNHHPDGFDLQVGERGANLSGGQRQAVAIARAFITDAPLLILDEPTSAMDNASEQVFMHHLKTHMAGKTLILVTHKTTMLPLVDRILVLNEGKLVADGPRDDILRALSNPAKATAGRLKS